MSIQLNQCQGKEQIKIIEFETEKEKEFEYLFNIELYIEV